MINLSEDGNVCRNHHNSEKDGSKALTKLTGKGSILLLTCCLLYAAQASFADSKTDPETPFSEAKRGERLFEQNGCNNCHSLSSGGGCLGPLLQGIRQRRSRQFILSRITDSKAAIANFTKLYGEMELMPHPRLNEKSASAIASYLFTLKAPPKEAITAKHLPPSEATLGQAASSSSSKDSIAKGKRLVYEKGCVSCHSIGEIGGNFAPAFDGVAKRLGRTRVLSRITQAERLATTGSGEYGARGTVMPPSNLQAEEIAAIADFLMTIKPNSHDKR